MKATWAMTLFFAVVGFTQEAKPPQITIHTWVREDIFAGFLFDDMDRFETGVKKLDHALQENPNNAPAMAWRGGAELYRAVRAHEAGKKDEFARTYAQATDLLAKAHELAPKDQGVLATTGGSYAVFADRLPAEHSRDAWKKANQLYQGLGAAQAQFLDKLPLHMRGELLAGIAMSAQRTGDKEQAEKYLRQIVESLPGSPYETKAKRWLEQPETAAKSSLTCQTCHEPGRLANRVQ